MNDAMGQMMGAPMFVMMGSAALLLPLLLVVLGLGAAALAKYLQGPK